MPRGQSSRKKTERKPTLSPTKILTYLACPLLYKFIYIDRIGRYLYKPKAYHSFGSSLHRAISDFHAAGGAEQETAEQLVERLHERWVSLGYTSEIEEQEHLEQAAEMIAEYHSSHVEPSEKTLLIEKQLKWDMGDFILIGRVDRLVETEDGTIGVIDYKSGRMSVTEEEVRNDLAMGIYQLLAARNYPGHPVSATIYCLRTGVKATVKMGPEELAELEDQVKVIAEEMLKIDSETVLQPCREEICDSCDFTPRCKRLARILCGEDWDAPNREDG